MTERVILGFAATTPAIYGVVQYGNEGISQPLVGATGLSLAILCAGLLIAKRSAAPPPQ